MSTVTPHLSLLKPAGSELVNVVTALNQNLDKLDADALTKNTRLNSVETLVGIAPWGTWTPVLTARTTVLTKSDTRAQFWIMGELVFCDLELLISTAGASYAPIAGNPTLKLKLPYEMSSYHVDGRAFVTYPSTPGTRVKFDPVKFDFANLNFILPTGNSYPNDPTDFTLETNSVFHGHFCYRTNGVAIP